LWIAALSIDGLTEDAAAVHADALASALASRHAPAIVVSNEVGLGVHPSTERGRAFRDLLGRANQRLAARADRALLLVAGRAIRLDDPDNVVL
jgi:adenosyl cobinamide kinase/adenosyl cobinamide phosphate guanylyltransferase